MSAASPSAVAIKEELAAFIAAGRGDFGDLALRLWAHQHAHNDEYRAICAGRRPGHHTEIPAVPVSLFRDLRLTSFPSERTRQVFRTSGTTGGRRGTKRLEDTDLYELAAATWARRCVGEIPTIGIGLVPTAADSSLGHMCLHLAPGLRSFFSADRGVDRVGALAALAAANSPVFVPGTAFAMAEVLAEPGDSIVLPEGSLIMVTGGFKGRRTKLDAEGLREALQARFPGTRVVAEYGMTELSSQLWANPAGSPFRPPPWMRVVAVDPWSGNPAQTGLLRFIDLANHQTVLAIETQDLGEVHADGSVTLHGRLAGARPRGCSLTVEEVQRV